MLPYPRAKIMFDLHQINNKIILMISLDAEKDGEMVQCANSYCDGAWFHQACVDHAVQAVPDRDWFCSVDCRNSSGYIYCICKSRKGAEDQQMLWCALKEDCRRHEFYHPSCVAADQEARRGQNSHLFIAVNWHKH